MIKAIQLSDYAVEEPELALFQSEGETSSEQAIEDIEKSGCQPFNWRALLVFIEKYPDVSKQLTLAALGDMIAPTADPGYGYFPKGHHTNGSFGVHGPAWPWPDKTCFLAVRIA